MGRVVPFSVDINVFLFLYNKERSDFDLFS